MKKIGVGSEINGWKLIEWLGTGGNAEVWRGENKRNETAALKILKKRDPNSEPAKRFRSEMGLLQKLAGRRGVIPLIDTYINNQQSAQPYLWFAMPVATCVREALGDSPTLEEVVDAVATYAEILTTLYEEEKVSHRDIKPENLFKLDRLWVIGDFGLASVPGKEALTLPGKRLGPQFYIAPEMLFSPDTADGNLADVYSLSKTLWALATGQQYSYPGEHRVDIAQITLEEWTKHPRSLLIDYILERATKTNPSERMSMQQLAMELREWLEPPVKAIVPGTLSVIGVRINDAIRPFQRDYNSKEKRERELKTHIDSLFANISERFKTVSNLVEQVIETEVRVQLDSGNSLCMAKPLKQENLLKRHNVVMYFGLPGGEISFWGGVIIDLTLDGVVSLCAAYTIWPDIDAMRGANTQLTREPLFMNRPVRIVWSNIIDELQMNSVFEEKAVDNLIKGLTENLEGALNVYFEMLNKIGV